MTWVFGAVSNAGEDADNDDKGQLCRSMADRSGWEKRNPVAADFVRGSRLGFSGPGLGPARVRARAWLWYHEIRWRIVFLYIPWVKYTNCIYTHWRETIRMRKQYKTISNNIEYLIVQLNVFMATKFSSSNMILPVSTFFKSKLQWNYSLFLKSIGRLGTCVMSKSILRSRFTNLIYLLLIFSINLFL